MLDKTRRFTVSYKYFPVGHVSGPVSVLKSWRRPAELGRIYGRGIEGGIAVNTVRQTSSVCAAASDICAKRWPLVPIFTEPTIPTPHTAPFVSALVCDRRPVAFPYVAAEVVVACP